MSNDPRLLYVIFEDLTQALNRWAADVATLSESAAAAMSGSQVAIVALSEDARRAQNDAERVSQMASETEQAIEGLRGQVLEAGRKAAKSVSTSQGAQDQAQQSVSLWSSGLSRAEHLLSSANGELANAQAALSQAQLMLNHAQSNLSNAQANLISCQNTYTTDSRGRQQPKNCSGYAAAVNNAQAQVQRAWSEVHYAEGRVTRAEAEVRRCQGLVNDCRQGLGKANSLARDAHRANELAADGQSSARRAEAELNEVDIAVQRTSEVARELSAMAADAARLSTTLTQDAWEGTDQLLRINELVEEQHRLTIEGAKQLHLLNERLRVFDTPDAALLS